MPDLGDGQSIEMRGSASRPYVLKNVGGVYSCSCPAWRHQSLLIERRTCKHLRRLRGDAAEEARIGASLPASVHPARSTGQPPPLLLAETWDGATDPTGWWLSEKLDGVRAYWDGQSFCSRQGHRYHAPAWFTAGLPNVPLDGELWLGRKQFQRTVSIVRRQGASDPWKEVHYLVFDAPVVPGGFEQRLAFVQRHFDRHPHAHARPHAHSRCAGVGHLSDMLARLEALGGEGLMLRQPGSLYVPGRSPTLLKVKRFHDDEAVVIGHEPGSGRHKGRLGALLVKMANGTRFAVGTGLTDAERTHPPPAGSTIHFRYQELSDRGLPRFPTYAGRLAISLFPQPKGASAMSTTTTKDRRRFEFTEGSSDKFWEIGLAGPQVTVRFGRIGSHGQTQTKSFANGPAARQHAERLIRDKTGKGYHEVA